MDDAGVEERVELRIGPGVETLERLLEDGATFDLAFIDADKPSYGAYYEACVALVRPGGLICIDNVLWSGRVADPTDTDASTEAIRAINARVAADERVDVAMSHRGRPHPGTRPLTDRAVRAQLAEAADRWGTPLYVTDLDIAAANLAAVGAALPGALVAYAVKANPDPQLLRRLVVTGAGCEVVTAVELALAIRAGCPAERIVMNGVGKTDAEARRRWSRRARERRVARRAGRAARARHPGARIGLRLNPGLEATTQPHLATGAATSKFGIPIAALPMRWSGSSARASCRSAWARTSDRTSRTRRCMPSLPSAWSARPPARARRGSTSAVAGLDRGGGRAG